MAKVAQDQGPKRGMWLSDAGQISFGLGSVNEVLIDGTYEDLKVKSMDERKSMYLEEIAKKPTKKVEVEEEKK